MVYRVSELRGGYWPFRPHRNHSQMFSLSTFIKCGFVPTLKDFNNFLVFLDRNQRFKVIIHVFSQLRSNKMNSDALTCTILTRALLNEHKYEEAADFLETLMQKSKSFHKSRIFDSLVQGLCTLTKNPDKGLSSLKDFLKADGSFSSPRTFCLLIHCFSSIGKMDRVIELLDLISNDKFKFPVDNYVCSSVISGFVRIGEPELAVGFYESAVKSCSLKPNTATCTAVVTAYCKLRSIGKIPDVVAWMQNNELEFDVVFYSNWIHGFFKEGLFSEALQIYRAIVDRKIELDAISYTILIAGFSNDGNVEKAVGFLYKMRKDGLKPNLVTYTAVILGFCKKGKLEEAFELFTMLKTLRFEFDEYTYAVLINGFCRNGDFDLVFQLLDEMEKTGINPGVVTYNTVINGLCKVGRTAEADDFSKGIVGDVVTYSTLLHGYVQERSASGILEIKRRLKAAGIHMDLVMCNILIKALLMVGLFEDALAIYKALPKMDLSANSVTYFTLIDGCCKLCMIDEALKIFNEFRKISHLSAACYSCIILGLCKKGMVDTAINVFSEYIEKGFHLDKEIYMTLIETILDKNGAQDILNAIYRMENLGLQALNIICNDTIGFLCKMGFLEAACSISLFVISSEGLELTSIRYYSILRALLIEGKKSLACLILTSYFKIYGLSDLKVIKALVHYLCLRDVRRALVLLSTVNKMKWSVTIPVAVFETLAHDGRVLDAYELFVQAESNLPAMTVVDYTIMIDALCKGRHVSKALDLCAFAKNKGIGLNTVTYNAVIHGLCCQGCLVEAFRLFDSLETIDVVASEFTYGSLIDALIKEGLLLDARILVKRMFLKGLHPSSHIFNSLISGYCKFGLLEEAVKLFQDLELRSLKPDGFTVAALINGYCQKGDMEGALRLFFDFKRRCLLPDFLGFMHLIRGLSARGRMEESRSILREMLQTQSVIDLLGRVDTEVKSDSVQNLLVLLCERGSINEAVTLLDEVGSMFFSVRRNSSYNALDSPDLGLNTDLRPSTHEEIDFHSLPSDVETKQNMLDVRASEIGKTQPLKDFDSFYALIRSLCLKGELAKANRLTKLLMKD